MSDTESKIDDVLESLEEHKKNIIAAALAARAELLEGLDNLADKVDDIDKDELRMKMYLAKIKILDEWDEIEEMLDGLGGKAKKVADASSDEVKEGWEAAKNIVKDIEEKVAKYLS